MIIQVLTLTLTVVALQGVNANFKKIAGFRPTNMISDEIALDRDQSAIETQLQQNTVKGVARAKRIYEKGGHSGSYAYVTLNNNLQGTFSEGYGVTFTANKGDSTTGTLRVQATAGTNIVEIVYPVRESFNAPVSCRVGGLPSSAQLKSGCVDKDFPVIINGVSYSVANVENKNYRTLKSLNDWLMGETSPELTIYEKWYGSKDFSDKWVSAGLASEPVPFTNYAMDITDYTFTGIRETVKKGIVYMGTMMTTLVYTYKASLACGPSATVGSQTQQDALKYVDLAWGYYVGSLQGSKKGNGKANKFYYALADKRCANFKTCGNRYDKFTGVAWVNIAMIKNYVKMRKFLEAGEPTCKKMELLYKDVVRLIVLPCLQGTLRYALKKAKNATPSEKEEAEGAVFYASILPIIAECDENAATTIFEEMKIRWPSDLSKFNSDYAIVKNAFESVYSCPILKYWCKEVGGIWSDPSASSPYPGAEWCCEDYAYLAKKKSCATKFDGSKIHLHYSRCEKHRTRGRYMYYWCMKSCDNSSPGIDPPGFEISACDAY